MRLQKLLAQAGLGSRRKCEEIILEGRAKVNGKIATIGKSVEESDKVTVDGSSIRREELVYVLLNKPKGIVVSMRDDFDRPTVLDVVKLPQRVFPVGRLDKDTEGLLLLTNDGDLAQKILHPSFELEKEYEVILNKPLAARERERLTKGIPLDRRKVSLKIRGTAKKLDVAIHEGRKHILKRIFARVGYTVVGLRRIRIGPLRVKGLAKREWRHLSKDEVKKLKGLFE